MIKIHVFSEKTGNFASDSKPEDKTWYIDMPWPDDRHNLAIANGPMNI